MVTQEEVVQQLKREVNISRKKVSLCAKEIVAYCEQEARKDYFITKTSENPYRERRSGCLML
eukprot:gene11953-13190_t